MKLKKWILPALLPVQWLLIKWASAHTAWVETNYSQGIYPKISSFLRILTGWIPFSIGDVLIIILIINLLAFFIKKVFKKKITFLELFRKALVVCSVTYFLFHALWGLNYYRKPLHQVLEIDNKYTTEQLERVCLQLVTISNKIHQKIEPNDSLRVEVPYSTNEIFEKTSSAFIDLKKTFPDLEYKNRSIKTTLFSKPQLYLGFSGYLNPFTNEAQVNRYLLKYKLPTTSCHEEAHQLGFAKENEANFIGIMACMKSTDLYFQYSGYTFALRYCLSELYRRDYQKYICAREKVNQGISKNYRENYEFWLPYDNPFEPYVKRFYGQFLKANNQSKGIKSYSYVVALFVNYFENNTL